MRVGYFLYIIFFYGFGSSKGDECFLLYFLGQYFDASFFLLYFFTYLKKFITYACTFVFWLVFHLLCQANKIGKINLAATGKDLMEDEKQGDVTIDLFAPLDMETEAVGERSSELENNQTLGLLTGFLAVDDW